jgi:poly-gamma-glutamate biosynthesis protein PgsC/CapC
MIAAAIGIGLVVSIVFSETLGIAAGGMVVPGYIAVHLNHPSRVVATIIAALATFLTIKFLSNFMLIYGRRHVGIVILVGFLFGYLTRSLQPLGAPDVLREMTAIGYIIPGLIAMWMERQGVIETISALLAGSVIVRLILVVVTGGEFVALAQW